jgi:glucuronosyltransferase
VRKWLPQRELLALEEVKAVITHCGWGGLTECVMCGKPMLAVPGFGDQPMNAKLLEERGIGLVLRPQPLGSFTKLLN